MNQLGEKIRELRAKKRWSLDELATRSGVPKTTIWGIEKGSQPSYDKINKLAAAFGISSLEFLSEDVNSSDYIDTEEFKEITLSYIIESVLKEKEFVIPFIEYINEKRLKSKHDVRKLLTCSVEDVEKNDSNYVDLMSLLTSIIDNRLTIYENRLDK